MSDPQYDFFYRSADQEANRELARRISARVVEAVRPAEAVFTDDAFDELMVPVAEGKVPQVNSGTAFGFGPTELLIMAVLPVVSSALTTIFINERVAGVRGLEELPAFPELTRRIIEEAVRHSRVKVSRNEIDRIVSLINQILAEELGLTMCNNKPDPGRCCGYDCGALRQLLEDYFTMDDLRTLCFDLGEQHENVFKGTPALRTGTRELLEYYLKRGRICDLVAQARRERQELHWDILT